MAEFIFCERRQSSDLKQKMLINLDHVELILSNDNDKAVVIVKGDTPPDSRRLEMTTSFDEVKSQVAALVPAQITIEP